MVAGTRARVVALVSRATLTPASRSNTPRVQQSRCSYDSRGQSPPPLHSSLSQRTTAPKGPPVWVGGGWTGEPRGTLRRGEHNNFEQRFNPRPSQRAPNKHLYYTASEQKTSNFFIRSNFNRFNPIPVTIDRHAVCKSRHNLKVC